jgi:hypothetical protein
MKTETLTAWNITKRALSALEENPDGAEFFEWKEDKQIDCLFHMMRTQTIDKIPLEEKVEIINDIKASFFDWKMKRGLKEYITNKKETA